MEQRPLSKLAVAIFILSLTPPSLFIISLIILPIDINFYYNRFLDHYLGIILLALIIISIVLFCITISSLLRIKRNNLRGTTLTKFGLISNVLAILLYIGFIWFNTHGPSCAGLNQSSAVSSLRLFVNAEAIWIQQDCDGNGIKNYWTYDISCLNRTYRPNRAIKVSFISVDLARADMIPASPVGGNTPFGTMKIEPWMEVTPTSKSGYCYMAMITNENGMPYNQNPVGPNKILATNSHEFAFMAYPVEYGNYYCTNTYIVNQEGTIYARNMGSDVNKIVLRWPNAVEIKKWRIAD
ncbi:MAG: DUF2950 family protein [Planctomycetes bacterium]|nr:DUF2950 family protein [Planctomycetota bacterium]